MVSTQLTTPSISLRLNTQLLPLCLRGIRLTKNKVSFFRRKFHKLSDWRLFQIHRYQMWDGYRIRKQDVCPALGGTGLSGALPLAVDGPADKTLVCGTKLYICVCCTAAHLPLCGVVPQCSGPCVD